jgi:hypothetical protein
LAGSPFEVVSGISLGNRSKVTYFEGEPELAAIAGVVQSATRQALNPVQPMAQSMSV